MSASPSPSAVPSNGTRFDSTFVDTPAAWGIAAFTAFAGCAISLFNCSRHLRNYTAPHKQRNIVRIIFIVPVYCVFSFFSLVLYEKAPYFNSIRDVYEAYVVYCFLNLILAYGGGQNKCCVEIARSPGSILHPFPLCKLPPLQLGSRFLHAAKRYTLQFVIIKPIFAVFSLFMLSINQHETAWYSWLERIIYNISYTLALYWLVLFYLATHHLPQLRQARPVTKFLAVKLVVFATYYQALFVSLVPGVPIDRLNRWNDFILCLEMVIFAVLQIWAYNWNEFNWSEPESGFLESMGDALSMGDVAQDIRHSFRPKYDAYAVATNGESGLSPGGDGKRSSRLNGAHTDSLENDKECGRNMDVDAFPLDEWEPSEDNDDSTIDATRENTDVAVALAKDDEIEEEVSDELELSTKELAPALSSEAEALSSEEDAIIVETSSSHPAMDAGVVVYDVEDED